MLCRTLVLPVFLFLVLFSVFCFCCDQIHLDTLESEGTQNIVMKPPVKLRKLIDKGGIGALFMLFFSLVFFILAVLACKNIQVHNVQLIV